MTLSGDVFGLLAAGLRKFAGQVLVSVAATVCATAIYGHIVSERAPSQVESEAISVVSPTRIGGGAIDVQTLAYYPEHLAAQDSLNRFHAVSVQRTAELAGMANPTRTAALTDAAKPRRVASVDVLPPPRPTTLADMSVLPVRRPVAPAVVAEVTPEPVPRNAKIWGVELPRFIPTGATVIDKLASVKDRIGGLIHVSSR
ncbi:MAG: hypothetical protein QOF41_2462 [Methylobacteriaceae bacterium]|jgi:hypothetical protein|nr:hypothetical protein [Methylobacteriaceae bacterium]